MLDGVKINEDFYKKDLDVDGFVVEKGFTGYQSCRLRPTIEVNGIYGGHTKEGGKTIIPSSATAKFSVRLVDNQDPQRLLTLFEQHVKKNINKAFKYEIFCDEHGSVAVETNTSSEVFKKFKTALEEEYGEKSIYIRAGGSIPIMSTFKQTLGCDIVFVGFGGPNSNCHGPNENYSLTSFEKGIKTLIRLLANN
jgi:acetylornithine deacetylase/succinyl-diaminopimelate desuccinylase-like protein